MQDEVNEKVVALSIKTSKLTAEVLQKDYNVKRIENGKPPTYLVSFRGKDIDVMTEAFREFSAKKLSREQKPSILKALVSFKEAAKQLNANRQKTKHKDRGIEL